jgi:hypothetical protein
MNGNRAEGRLTGGAQAEAGGRGPRDDCDAALRLGVRRSTRCSRGYGTYRIGSLAAICHDGGIRVTRPASMPATTWGVGLRARVSRNIINAVLWDARCVVT